MEKWRDWETETKEMYEEMYIEAINIKEVAAGLKIKELVCGVDKELKKADRLCLKLNAVGYNLDTITLMQDEIHDKYKEKTKEDFSVEMC
jgi:hypothetical protein